MIVTDSMYMMRSFQPKMGNIQGYIHILSGKLWLDQNHLGTNLKGEFFHF